MKNYLDLALREFLDDTAARQPTPGGGSCAALAGAVAVSLAEMAARYTLTNDRYKVQREAVGQLLDQLSRLQRIFRELMAEDMAAYEACSSASKGAGGSEEQREQFRLAIETATAVPLEVVTAASSALRAMADLKDKCSRSLLSDLSAAAWLVEAAAMAAAENVRVNLARLPDPSEASRIEQTLREELSHISALRPVISG